MSISETDKVVLPQFLSYTVINSSSGALYQLIAAVPRAIRAIRLADTTGVALGIYVDGVLEVAFAPGETDIIPCIISEGTTVSIRSLEGAPVAGSVVINFLG